MLNLNLELLEAECERLRESRHSIAPKNLDLWKENARLGDIVRDVNDRLDDFRKELADLLDPMGAGIGDPFTPLFSGKY